MGKIYKLEGTLRHLTDGSRRTLIPREMVESEVNRVKNLISEEGLFGELGEPGISTISLQNISHKILDIELKENLDYTVEIEVLDTPCGQMVCDLIDGGYLKPTFRAMAGETEDGPVFSLITFDIVNI